MNRQRIVQTIGAQYHQTNIEEDEWSYVKDAGSMAKLADLLGRRPAHFKLDRRFTMEDESGTYAVLVETKQIFVDEDAAQLADYVAAEYALHPGNKVIAILANTSNDLIRVWKSDIDDDHLLENETVLDNMEHYKRLFNISRQNDREKVMRNTYALNDLLHKKDIKEALRSQFVGTCLLFIKHEVETYGKGVRINEALAKSLKETRWMNFSPAQIRTAIGSVLEELLDGSKNKEKKIELLKRNVLNDQKVKELSQDEWIEVLTHILLKIYRYIDTDSSEGQDILNLFFITFNKYVGKADKNQAFTPDHIAEFMTQLVEITHKDIILDECCGSGSFLVQALVKELADARRGSTDEEYKKLAKEIKDTHIFGIENEEKAYGLATTNMLIHGDGNSNVEFGSCFAKKQFIINAKPTVILMNPPYNSKPRSIPSSYKTNWSRSEKDGVSEPTKGLVFVKYLSDIAKKHEWEGVRLAVLLSTAAAIGTGDRLRSMKEDLLKDNTLEAVFSLPPEIFYPGASVNACCMFFTLNKSHYKHDGVTPYKKTFFGYYRDDGFVKRKNLGRVEQFDSDGNSEWKKIEEKWLDLYRNKTVEAGFSTMKAVTGADEWLAEAYMETDYSKLCQDDFQSTINSYLAYLVQEGKVYES